MHAQGPCAHSSSQMPKSLPAPFKSEPNLTRRRQAIGIPLASTISQEESSGKTSHAPSPDTQPVCIPCAGRQELTSVPHCSILNSAVGPGMVFILLSGAPEHLSIHPFTSSRNVLITTWALPGWHLKLLRIRMHFQEKPLQNNFRRSKSENRGWIFES